GLDRNLFGWSTVKLYYACFYLAKAMLNRSGKCVLYVGSSPVYVECTPGSSPVREKGNSHTVVAAVYESEFPGGVLSVHPVGGLRPFRWLGQQREKVNYRDLKFSDPDPPNWFKHVERNGVRQLLSAYVS